MKNIKKPRSQILVDHLVENAYQGNFDEVLLTAKQMRKMVLREVISEIRDGIVRNKDSEKYVKQIEVKLLEVAKEIKNI